MERGVEVTITDHTFRILGAAQRTSKYPGSAVIDKDMCGYRGTCNQPRERHVTVSDFRAAKAAGLVCSVHGKHPHPQTEEYPNARGACTKCVICVTEYEEKEGNR